ncbi:MAG: glycosyltransferase family 2 protein [Planctomycetes bacterium]|nr:glycosyltransferase family 2 protein [Planctomycetota bacterium]
MDAPKDISITEQEKKKVKISVVLPVFNEAENVPLVASGIIEVLDKLNEAYEIIFVDDGSKDNSFEVLKGICSKYKVVRTIRFKKNCGETAALDAGFKAARGDWVVAMDADLQTDPNDIPKMLEKTKEYDVVWGYRDKRNDPWIKLISSKVANFVRNKLTNENIRDVGCPLRVIKKECLDKLKLFTGLHRFMPTLCKMEGYRVVELEIKHSPRRYGKSKYNIWNRVFRSFVDLLAVRWMLKRRLGYEVVESTMVDNEVLPR